MIKSLFGAVLLAIIVSCGQKTTVSDVEAIQDEPIKGLWKLHIMEIKDSVGNWQEWRDGMKGFLLYDGDGHMALHLIPKNYENTDLAFPNFTDTISIEALQYITNNYNYFGTYEVDTDSNIVNHYRISHSNPGEWHTKVRRRYSFSGDTLIVKPVEEKNARLRLKLLKEK